jgi:hypothetical protein
MRRILLLLALIISASSLALGQTNFRHAHYIQAGSASTQCRGEQLSVKHIPDSDEAAMGGVRIIDYSIKNISSLPCTLTGYPRVELLTKSGRLAPHGRATHSEEPASDEQSKSSSVVTLAPGKTAWFRFHFNAGGAGYTGKPCPTFPRLRITAPGTKRSFVLRESIQSCSGVEVSAVQSGLPE